MAEHESVKNIDEIFIKTVSKDGCSLSVGRLKKYCEEYFKANSSLSYKDFCYGVGEKMKEAGWVQNRGNIFCLKDVVEDIALQISHIYPRWDGKKSYK